MADAKGRSTRTGRSDFRAAFALCGHPVDGRTEPETLRSGPDRFGPEQETDPSLVVSRREILARLWPWPAGHTPERPGRYRAAHEGHAVCHAHLRPCQRQAG